jgi:hypothetical protein
MSALIASTWLAKSIWLRLMVSARLGKLGEVSLQQFDPLAGLLVVEHAGPHGRNQCRGQQQRGRQRLQPPAHLQNSPE